MIKSKKKNFDTHEKIATEDFLPVGLKGEVGGVHGCQSHTSNKFKRSASPPLARFVYGGPNSVPELGTHEACTTMIVINWQASR